MTPTESASLALIAGSGFGVVLGIVAALLFATCGPDETRDEHEQLWIEKLPAEPAIVTPADGCWYGGEKLEWGTWTGEPRS